MINLEKINTRNPCYRIKFRIGRGKKVTCDLVYFETGVYLLVMDFSKFIELAKLIDSQSTDQTIDELKKIF